MIDKINSERASAGLPPLRENAALNAAAQKYADKSTAEGRLDHTGSDGSKPWDRMNAEGFKGERYAENLAGAPDVNTAHTNLMNSPGHRNNIVSLLESLQKYRLKLITL